MRAPLAALAAAVFTAGCTHSIHQVQVSDFRPYKALERGDVVAASAEQFTVMGFTGETNYVDQAYQRLQQKCPTGNLTGITTQISTSHGFFSWTNKALMQGLCVKTTASGGSSDESVKNPRERSKRKPSATE